METGPPDKGAPPGSGELEGRDDDDVLRGA